MRIALTIAVVCLGTTIARADAVEDTPVTTAAGKEVRLGAYTSIRADCSGGTATVLRPNGDQHGGLVVVVAGTLTTSHAPGCSSVTAPAQILYYRPNPGFTGTDRVTFGLTDPTTGRENQHSVVVTVTP